MEVRAEAKLLRVPLIKCNYVSKFYPLLDVPLGYQLQVHNSCICNEARSLVERHLITRDYPIDLKLFNSKAREFSNMLNLKSEPMTYGDVIDGYSGAKKRRYKRARETISQGLRVRAWSAVQMFVKPDRYSVDSVKTKAPRAIQYRSPCFNLMIARWLKPIEHDYYQSVDEYGLRVVAKGLNNLERAHNIVEAAGMFRNPVFVLLDHSKFDSCVQVKHLRFLHRIYTRAIRDPRFKCMLQYQINNRGFTKGGIRYKVQGTRMSGDYDTGLGNTILNHYLMYVVFRNVKFHLLLDGDDSVVVMEKSELVKVDFGEFARLGFGTTYKIVSELNQVEFCRAILIPDEIPRFARDPVRAITNMSASFNWYTEEGYRHYLAGLGLGEAAASNGVPIISVIAAKLVGLSNKPIINENIKYMYGEAGPAVSITDAAREAVYVNYGISPALQEYIEKTWSCPRRVSTRFAISCYLSYPSDRDKVFT